MAVTDWGVESDMLESDCEFREFMIWLCGFTDAVEAPSQDTWEKLQHRTKEIAARYALQRRDRLKRDADMARHQAAMTEQQELEWRTTVGTTTTVSPNIAINPYTTTTGTSSYRHGIGKTA